MHKSGERIEKIPSATVMKFYERRKRKKPDGMLDDLMILSNEEDNHPRALDLPSTPS